MAAVPELIGRERELARLAELAAAAKAGRGALLLLAGEAGAGKTALARSALAATGFRTLEAAATEMPGAPYRPIAGVLRAYRREGGMLLRDQPGLQADLACLLPELAPGQRPHGPPPTPDSVFEAVAAAFREMSAAGPLAVLFDDLHWSDEATLDLLRLLAEVAERSPIVLVGAYRSDAMTRAHPMRRLRTELRRAGSLQELVVEPLGPADTGRLLERVLAAPAAPDLVAAVHDRTEGLPFFVEELAAALKVAGGESRLPLPESVDEIHRLGSTLNEMLARLEAGLEHERAFVADASHELRAPLTVLKAELEVALMEHDTPSAVRDVLTSAAE
ncbi:MAG: hypothetical protein DLM67_19280, partial [Candidatus Nephthysia bennettiae]